MRPTHQPTASTLMVSLDLHRRMASTAVLRFVFLCAWGVACVQSQGGQGCAMQCPTSEPYIAVEITTDDTFRNVATSTCPPYENPGWSNPNTACQADTTFNIPLIPKYAKVPIPVGEVESVFEDITYLKTDPAPVFGSLGVLKNGVNVFGVGSPCGFSSKCTDEGAPTDFVDAVESEGHTVDDCGGHADPMRSYHIHSGIGINSTEQREKCNLPADVPGEHSMLLGWMFDGFGLYGRYSQGGLVPTDLDQCHGHTHEIDGVMTYHYHLPDGFPWTIGCYKGCPEVSNNQNQLSYVNSDPEFGCPDGLDEDPDPLVEAAPMNTTEGTSTTDGTVVGVTSLQFISLAVLAICALILGL